MLILAAFTLGIAGSQQGAGANVVTAQWNSPSSYAYKLKHMPDFNQRRGPGEGVVALPNNGAMYCFPTCAINKMAYAANHGFPMVSPGNEPWYAVQGPGSVGRYNTITLNIWGMGQRMGTDPFQGTQGGVMDGYTSWLNQFAPGMFTVTRMSASGNWAPKASDIAFASLQGGITSFGYGRYTTLEVVEGVRVIQRVPGSGHCVTLTEIYDDISSPIEIFVRDPATPGVGSTQFTFENRKWFGENELVARDSLSNIRVATRMWLAGGVTADRRYIETYITIRPAAGYAFIDAVIPPPITKIAPIGFGGTPVPVQNQFVSHGLATIKRIEPSPNLASLLVLGTNTNGPIVGILDMRTDLFRPIIEDPDIADATFSRFGAAYIMVGGSILCIKDIDGESAGANADPLLIPWPFPATGIAFSDFNDQLHGVARFGTQVASLPIPVPAGFGPIIRPLPEGLPFGANPKILASPDDGTIWIWSEADPRVFQFAINETDDAWELLNTAQADGCTPTAVAMGDRGHLFLTCNGTVVELMPEELPDKQVVWVVNANSLFEQYSGLSGFIPEMSRTNFDPAEHGQPEWLGHDHPDDLEFGEPFVDCLGDLNGDRVVDTDDLAILLGAFGNSSLGDLNVDQVTDTDDLAIFLGIFGQPCPDPI